MTRSLKIDARVVAQVVEEPISQAEDANQLGVVLDGSCEPCMAWFNGAIAIEIKAYGADPLDPAVQEPSLAVRH